MNRLQPVTDALRKGDVGYASASVTVLECTMPEKIRRLFVMLEFEKHGAQAIGIHAAHARRGGAEVEELRFIDAKTARAYCDLMCRALPGSLSLVNPGIDSWWPTRERLVPVRRRGSKGIRVSSSKPQKNRIAAGHPYQPGRDHIEVSIECVHRQGEAS